MNETGVESNEPTVLAQIQAVIEKVKSEPGSRCNSLVITKLEEAALWYFGRKVLEQNKQ